MKINSNLTLGEDNYSSIKRYKTFDNIFPNIFPSDKKPVEKKKSSYIKTIKKDFSYFMSLENYNEGLVETIFEILCVKTNWQKDQKTEECMNCKKVFSLLNRKHHCRCCGLIFCNECSKYFLKIDCNFFHEELISTFKEVFNCDYNKKENKLILKICLGCFSENLDDFVSDANYLTKVPNTRKSFKTVEKKNYQDLKFEAKKSNLIKNKQFKKTTNQISNFLYDLILKENPDCYLKIDFLNKFLENLFIHFEYLTQYKIDFNQMDLKNIVEITRIHSEEDLNIEFFNGIILKLNSNNYFKNSREISFPTFLIIKKNYCISHCDEKGNFKYLNLNDIQSTMDNSEEYLKSLFENENHKIDLVFSEFPLPTDIYFLMKKKNIEFIFPLKREKLNLIERYTKSSKMWLQLQKFHKSTDMEKEILLTGFAGEIKILQINFKNNNSYRVLLQKKSEKHSFNTFSIIIKGALDFTTKVFKEVLKKFLPYIFHKYLELHVFDIECNSLKMKEIQKMKNKSNINSVSFLNLNNYKENNTKIIQLLNNDDFLVYFEVLINQQSPVNTYKEYAEHFRHFMDRKDIFFKELKKIDFKIKEFNAMEAFYDYVSYSYLANLNLSKNTKMVKSCLYPIQTETKIYGKNDTTIYKTIKQLFKNNDTRCLSCTAKFKYHSRMFYINCCSIKMDTYKIKMIGKNYIYPSKNDNYEFDFMSIKKQEEKVFKDRHLGYMSKIRTAILCMDCFMLLNQLCFLTDVFQCLSFSYLLLSFTFEDDKMDLSCFSFDDEFEDDEEIKQKKNPSHETNLQIHKSITSMKNLDNQNKISISNNFPSQKFVLNSSKKDKELNKNENRCCHQNISRVFIQNDYMQSFTKKKVTVFRLLINSEVKSGEVNNAKRIKILEELNENFNFFIDYLVFILSSLEKLFFLKNTEHLKKNIKIIIDTSADLKKLKIQKKFEIGNKSQKLSNDDFFKCLDLISNRVEEFKFLSRTELEVSEEKFKICDINKVIEKFPDLKDHKEEQILESMNKLVDKSFNNKFFEGMELEEKRSFISTSSRKISNQSIEEKKDSFFLNNETFKHIIRPNNILNIEGNQILFYKTPLSYYANYLNQQFNNKESFENNSKSNEKEYTVNLNENLDILNFKLDEMLKSKFYDMAKMNKCEAVDLYKEYFQLNLKHEIKNVKMKLIEYYGQKFQELRKLYRINLEYFFHSISEIENYQTSGGKTDANFFMTNDKKYIAKEINSTEFKSFLKFCPDYITYLQEINNSNKKSLLCLIFGLFKLNKKTYIIMENLNFFIKDNGKEKIIKTYDLKGSELNRLIFNVHKNQTLPDTNFQIERNGDPIYFKSKKIKNLHEILQRDTFFLSKKELIDYSLLLVLDVSNNLAFMKIIDYLREYDFTKNIENKWKQIRNNANPTIVETNKYRDRFLNSAEKYFILIN